MSRRARLLLVGAAFALAAGTGLAASAASPVPAEELLDRLDRAHALAEAGVASPSEPAMAAVRDAIGLPADVGLGGSVATVPRDPVLERLRGASGAEFGRAAARIAVLRDALASAASAEPLDGTALDAALERAYREGGIQVRPGLAERIRRGVADLVNWLVRQLFSFQGGGTVVAWLVLAALAALALWLLRRLRFVPGAQVTSGTASTRTRPADRGAQVEAALRSGDLTAAVHAAYRLLVATLARRGLLVEVPGLTAGECRAAVRASDPELGAVVAGATDAFERVAYGRIPAASDDVEALLEAERMARAA